MNNKLTTSITDDQKIELFVNRILNLDPTSTKDVRIAAKMAYELGEELSLKVVPISDIIKKPLEEMGNAHVENEKVAENLQALRNHINVLNPVNRNFEREGILATIMDILPFTKTPIETYKEDLKTGEMAIKSVMSSLEQGEKQLTKDNEALMRDQLNFWKNVEEIRTSIDFALKIDHTMESKLEHLEEIHKTFIRSEFLFPLRQRILDLQQQSAVFSQADLSTKLIIDNNRQLINSVHRTRNVTVSALQVATMTSFALMHQKSVMTKIDSVNKTTSDLLTQNAKSLKTQGTLIQKQATTSMLDIEGLKTSFHDLNEALTEIQHFRSVTLADMKIKISDYQSFIETTEQVKHIEHKRS